MTVSSMVGLPDDVLERIHELLAQAVGLPEPRAMSLATADESGKPAVRTVLLKHVDRQGLTFFTNTTSRKGQHIAANPFAALCLYFQESHRQLQVEGRVQRLSDEQADSYWYSRPRASRIGAWASRQSTILEDRRQLLNRVARYEEKFADTDVPRPPFWSGYRIIPHAIEFWNGHPDRLNERTCYRLTDGEWVKFYRYP